MVNDNSTQKRETAKSYGDDADNLQLKVSKCEGNVKPKLQLMTLTTVPTSNKIEDINIPSCSTEIRCFQKSVSLGSSVTVTVTLAGSFEM